MALGERRVVRVWSEARNVVRAGRVAHGGVPRTVRCGRHARRERVRLAAKCCVRSVARKVLRAQCVVQGAVRPARELEASALTRRAAARRGVCGLACSVLRAQCVVQGAVRSARELEASARRRRAERPAASRRAGALWCMCVWVVSGWRVSGWRLRCRVRGVGRKVCVREVLRTVRCGRRASWKQVRGGGGLWSSLRRGLRGVPGVCVCSRDEQTARNVSVR